MVNGSDETLIDRETSAGETDRPRRVRSKSARNSFVAFLSFCFSGALALVLAAVAVLYWGKTQFDGPGPLRQEATFLVPKGGGLDGISASLERSGIVSDARIFEYGVRFERAAGQLKAGEYAFAPGASMRDVMNTIRSGNSILHTITIPEGWTVAQIYARIAADDTLVGDLPPEAPEGSLLPETYKFTRGLSRAELVSQMSAAQTKLVAEIWKTREDGLPISDIGQFVTLASIVEKETGIDSERPHVASVFVNRLRKNMRLQSDPTIIYGIWGGAGKPANEPIRQSHIASDTPYNTYVIRGLPPGPIANPGRAALEAVAHPLDTDDLYFVADGTGGHAFSRTLDEHNSNVRRLRDIEKRAAVTRGQSAAPGAEVE
ncbi:endolytic transglycosylase MltG [Aureimonas ureilytica]|uniref:endolytic transglycosylase MltG n=1 Tax=Aureimonas ureilytica TaxID=401562 RepID=UPI003CEC8690